jgi:TonB family protein
MITRQTFALSLSVIFTIVTIATNISYAHDVVSSMEGKVESSLSSAPGVSIVKQVDAIYPPLAKAARVSGAVIVEVAIARTGQVTSAKILSGHPLLKEPSLAAARKWEFTPISPGEATEEISGVITFDYIIPEVREELKKAELQVAGNPDSSEAHTNLARCYGNSGRKDDAIREYHEALRLHPAYEERVYSELAYLYNRNEGFATRLETLQRGLQIFPNSVLLLKHLGGELDYTGNYSEAIEVYQKVLLREPQDVDLLCATAQLYQNLFRFEESLVFLDRATARNPLHHMAKEKTGFAYLQLGRLDEAEECLKEAVTLHARTASASEYLGDVYLHRGNLELALQNWKEALSRAYEAGQKARIEAKVKAYSN